MWINFDNSFLVRDTDVIDVTLDKNRDDDYEVKMVYKTYAMATSDFKRRWFSTREEAEKLLNDLERQLNGQTN